MPGTMSDTKEVPGNSLATSFCAFLLKEEGRWVRAGTGVPMEGRVGLGGRGHTFAKWPCRRWHLHALLLSVLGTVRAIEELALEKLNGDDGKDEHEELVDDENVEDVLQGGHHAVEDSLGTEASAQVREALGRPKHLPEAERVTPPPVSPTEKVPQATGPC